MRGREKARIWKIKGNKVVKKRLGRMRREYKSLFSYSAFLLPEVHCLFTTENQRMEFEYDFICEPFIYFFISRAI